MPELQLFDPVDLARAIGASADADDPSADDAPTSIFAVPSFDTDRAKILRRIQADPRGPTRSLAVGTDNMLTRLDEVLETAPHFADAIAIVRSAVLLSRATGAPLAPPPILLVGPPGLGKTYVTRQIAAALAVPYAEVSLATSDDIGCLIGHSQSWRAARPGLIAKLLIEHPSGLASPMVAIEELDKAVIWNAREEPTNALHALLEPENARVFADQFLEFPIRADHVVYVLTCNDPSRLKDSLLDRMLVVPIAAPTPDHHARVARSIYHAVIAPYGGAVDLDLGEAVVAALDGVAPRRMRRMLQIALGFAIAAGRRRLAARDIAAAARLMEFGQDRNPIGFLPHG